MNQRLLIRFLSLLFTFGLFGVLVWQVIMKPRVMVLQSYTTHYTWTAGVQKGIDRILGGKPYSIRTHYMDTKRHPSLEFKQSAGRTALQQIYNWEPNVIIAVDDNAQQYVTKHLVNDDNYQIVYSGVGASLAKYGFDTASNPKNVTGIREDMPLEAVKKALQSLFAESLATNKPVRIFHISDLSTSSQSNIAQVEKFDWHPFNRVASVGVNTIEQWKKAVVEWRDKADIILFTNYHTLNCSEAVNSRVVPGDVVKWTERNSGLPGIGAWGFYVADGGMLSIGVSPFEQGEVAADMAVHLIDDGLSGREIKRRKTEQFFIYMRRPTMERHHLQLSPIYEAFARATDNYKIDDPAQEIAEENLFKVCKQ